MKKDVAISVKNVTKDFYLPRHKSDSLKQSITQAFKPKEKGVDVHRALKGISFEVKKGEFFGVLGRNGSGKSTLLKIISEIYKPTSGTVEHDGTLVSFIELGVGFKAELTGRENVYLNGALLGFSKKEIDERYDEIVGFAELEDFMERKLKNYSSGMKVRLAFAVAIQAKSDILILDEVLAVGDAAFQKKCTNYFKTLRDNEKTVILVTHSMGNVREFCNRAVVIEDGKVIFDGDGGGAADTYLGLFGGGELEPHDNSKFDSVTVDTVVADDSIVLNLAITPASNLENPVVTILINKGKERVYRWVSDEKTDKSINLLPGTIFSAALKIQSIFPVGEYTVDVAIKDIDRTIVYGLYERISSFRVGNKTGYRHDVLWQPKESFIRTNEG